MKYQTIAAICISLLLLSCKSNGSRLELLGLWTQQRCNQVEEGFDFWVQSTYEFSEDGELKYELSGYVDSDCTQKPTAFIPGIPMMTITLESSTTIHVPMDSINYSDLGIKPLQEGVQGREIMFHINLHPEYIDIIANYYLEHNKLCFSNAFQVNERNLVFSKVADDSIDFTNCLSRQVP